MTCGPVRRDSHGWTLSEREAPATSAVLNGVGFSMSEAFLQKIGKFLGRAPAGLTKDATAALLRRYGLQDPMADGVHAFGGNDVGQFNDGRSRATHG